MCVNECVVCRCVHLCRQVCLAFFFHFCNNTQVLPFWCAITEYFVYTCLSIETGLAMEMVQDTCKSYEG